MSQHLLTRRMADVLKNIQRANRPPFHALSVRDARIAYEVGSEILEFPRAPLARVDDFFIPAADGSALRARLYAPTLERLPTLLYLHGTFRNLYRNYPKIEALRAAGFGVLSPQPR